MTTVSFEKLVCAASEICTAKDNVAEAQNNTLCGISGDRNNAVICGFATLLLKTQAVSQRR